MFSDDVLYVISRARRPVWVTPRGEVAGSGSLAAAVGRHGGLVRAASIHLNLDRVRAIEPAKQGKIVRFDSGDAVKVSRRGEAQLAHALGLPHLDGLEPLTETQRAMFDLGLRDWPKPLFDMPPREVRAWVGDDEDCLIANVVWDVARRRARGELLETYGRYHRGFWYVPLEPVLAHARFVRQERWATRDFSDPHYARYLDVVRKMVGELRLLTYRELGFQESRPDLRGVGALRPWVVLLGEKASLLDEVKEAARRFGFSWYIAGGDPGYVSTEFFADLVRGRRILILAHVDFDPQGWDVARSFAKQLQRYGVEVEGIRWLVVPSRFSREEIERIKLVIPAPTKGDRKKVRTWIRESGGVDGKGYRIHADFMQPLARLLQAIREESGFDALA